VAAGLTGPVADAAHHDFTVHMGGHLLVGMIAPLLLVAARPVTVALQALPVRHGRRLARLLSTAPVRVLTHPVTAAVLSAGGLWLLYRTGLYALTRHDELVHLGVHVHVLLAGYLFTAAVIGRDPAPHRSGFATRAGTLVLILAAHGILAKYLYGHPPAGVPDEQARTAGLLMYYGGDLIDIGLMVVLCRQWYASSRPRRVSSYVAAGSGP
jgi:putative membrane protein